MTIYRRSMSMTVTRKRPSPREIAGTIVGPIQHLHETSMTQYYQSAHEFTQKLQVTYQA